MKNFKRLLAVLLIICGAVSIGFLLNFGWNRLDQVTHPRDYSEYVTKYSEEYHIPEDVILAVIKVESGFDASAESSVGAMGLMQMMPSTFTWLTGEEHLREYLPESALLEPEISIRYGTYYLNYLYEKFDNWDTVFAAYNGGEGNVAKWLADPECSDGNGNLTYIPFEETRSYVYKVKEARLTYQKLYYEEKKGTAS